MNTKMIKNATDEELRKELEDRKLARKNAALEVNRHWLAVLQKVLNVEVIDMLAPKHLERSGCTDNNHWNGFGVGGCGKEPECIRCGFLELMKGDAVNSVLDNLIELEVVIKVISL